MKVYLLVNPKSGSYKKKHIDQLQTYLHQEGLKYKLCETEYSGHMEEIVRKIDFSANDLLLISGGDGALSEAVNGLDKRQVNIGIIPAGTVNVVAHFLRMPANKKDLVRILSRKKSLSLFPGKVSGRLFVFSASVGPDSFALADVDLKLKSKIGRFAYMVSFFKSINKGRKNKISLKIDEKEEISCFGVIVGKLQCYAGHLVLFDKAFPENNYYQLCWLTKGSLFPVIISFLMILAGLGKHSPWLKFSEAKKIEIDSEKPLPLQVDGDLHGTTPALFEPSDHKISLICNQKD